MKRNYLLICLFFQFAYSSQAQIVPPYFNDFETGSAGWYDSTISGSSWQLGIPNYGTTTGTHSGNNAWDISLDSAYLSNSTSYLYSPFFNFSSSTSAVLTFWQNHNTEFFWDKTMLEYTTDSATTWKTLGLNFSPTINWYQHSINGYWGWWGNSNCWILSSIGLDSAYGFSKVQFRFVFTSDASVIEDGFSLDDFSISIPQANDAAIAGLISPMDTLPSGNLIPVTIRLANTGSDTLTSVNISYSINGGSPFNSVWNGSLAPNQLDTFNMTGFVVPNGLFRFCVYITGDSVLTNDTICCDMVGVLINGISQQETKNNLISVFPNPSNQSCLISATSFTNATLSLCGISGRVLMQKYFCNQLQLDISNLAKGVYTIELKQADGKREIAKLVRQ